MTVRNRAIAVVIAILILGVGVIFVTIGFAVLAVLAVGGVALGAGIRLYYRLRHRSHPVVRERLSTSDALDPSLEVRPNRPAIVQPREGDEA